MPVRWRGINAAGEPDTIVTDKGFPPDWTHAKDAGKTRAPVPDPEPEEDVALEPGASIQWQRGKSTHEGKLVAVLDGDRLLVENIDTGSSYEIDVSDVVTE